ncbi:serpin B3-like isoform X2 [Procambarus clarkii]
MATSSHKVKASSLSPYAHHEDVVKLAVSQNNFTRDLCVELTQKIEGNLFFSPFSVMTALGMTYAGAVGNTEQEMRSVMHLSQDKAAIHNAFQDVVTDLKSEAPHYEIRTSNMEYISDKMTILSDYNNIMKEKYLSCSKTVNFSEGEQVRKEINNAVEKETNSHIKNLIPEGMFNSLTRMVLVNAVYFKGEWKKQFKNSATEDEEFWITDSESTMVPMMHITDNYCMQHDKDLGATFLVMEYKGSRLSMVFVLPDKRDGLAKVEANLPSVNLNKIGTNLPLVKVRVTLPKFKITKSLELVNHLKEMGVKDLFDASRSDLSGITGTKDLFVTDVIHQAYLEVNEKGSEAAAATAIQGMVGSSWCLELHRFVADHPFLFFIKDQRSGLVLFAGRLAVPQDLSAEG